MTTPRLFLIFCVLCLTSGASVRAERKSAPIVGAAPPQPIEMNLKVHREAKTEITLRIYGKAGEPLKYLIRVPPVHGRLSEPRSTEREVAVVVYEPPADLGITTDKFAYAVQNSIGVSAAVEVNLTIVDQPPQLTIQDTIDFSTIRAGSSTSRLLEISNRGGLIATGEVIVDEPWKIDGKTGYQLRAGDVAVFKVVFASSVGGKFEGVARYTSDREHSTTLRGVAEAAIAANPAQWVLQQMPGDPVRSGAFELINQLDEPRTLQLRTDPRLKIPSQVTIEPHHKVTVSVEASSEDARAFDAEIRLEASDFTTAVPVHVPVLEAVLRTTTPVVAFGRVTPGHKASATFDLENIGGTPGSASWEISPPFHVPESSIVLEPGEKKVFQIEIDGKTPGRYRTWLQFKAGAQTFDLPVQAEVAAYPKPSLGSPTAPGSTPYPDVAPPGESTEANATESIVAPTPDWLAVQKLPKGVQVTHITQKGAVVEWPASLAPGITHFRVDLRRLKTAPGGNLEISWVPLTGIPIESRGATYAAIFTDLIPGQPWTVRVLPLQANGDAGDRLFAVDFLTARRPSLLERLSPHSPVKWLIGVLAALLVWQVVRRLRIRASA